MSVSCQSLYEDVAAQFGFGVEKTRLNNCFVHSVNRSLDQLSLRANLETRMGHIVDVSESVGELDTEYEYILRAGVLFYMNRAGIKPADPRVGILVMQETAKDWEDAIGDFITAELNKLQEDTDNDVAMLGSLTS